MVHFQREGCQASHIPKNGLHVVCDMFGCHPVQYSDNLESRVVV